MNNGGVPLQGKGAESLCGQVLILTYKIRRLRRLGGGKKSPAARTGDNDLFGFMSLVLSSRELCEEALVCLKGIAGLYLGIACDILVQ